MVNESGLDGLKEKINEKEKILIENIAGQVSEQIGDNLTNSIESISGSLSEADKNSQIISDVLGKVSENVQVLSSYDFSEQFERIKTSNDALELAAKSSKEVFDISREHSEKLLDDIGSTLISWKNVRESLSETISNIRTENSDIALTLSEIKTSMTELSGIESSITDTMKKIEELQESVAESISSEASKKIESLIEIKVNDSIEKLSEAVDRTDEKTRSMMSGLEKEISILQDSNKDLKAEIEDSKRKTNLSPIMIATAVMAGASVILNLILLFTK